MDCFLSKTGYCRGTQCPKMLWMDRHKKEEATPMGNEQILKNGTEVGELARKLFGDEFVNIDRPNFDAVGIMIAKTEDEIYNGTPVITEASFYYKGNFCSVDILRNLGNHFEIYEVKSSTEVKDIYLDDISYQYFVMTKLGYNVTKVCLVHINNQYVRQGELNLHELFHIEDLTEEVILKQDEVEKRIENLVEVIEIEDEPNKELSKDCFEPYPCQYWEYCSKDLPKPNVFDLTSKNTFKMNKNVKSELYHIGKISYEELKDETLPADTMQQIEYELNNKTNIDVDNIRNFMKQLTYPIYFFDFETYQTPIPEYDGIKPFQQIPFQYSLHYIEKDGGELKHKEFLAEAGKDCRREIAEKIVNDIPKNVCVTAYHSSFEKTRLEELARMFPDLSEHLLNIKNNIYDFEIPFKNRWYYNKAMQGRTTIKLVLPALYPDDPELDYHNLDDVHNGTEASSMFLSLPNLDEETRRKIRENMLKYCKLDTYAMVKVWEKLKEI